MMTVIVKKDSKILLFTKGADSSIFPLAKGPDSTHVDNFAKQGFRTLVFAMRDLSTYTELDL